MEKKAMSRGFTKGRLIALLLCIVLIGTTLLPTIASAAKYNAPVMKKAVLNSNGIKITWKGSSGATGYRVYRRTSPKADWKAIAESTIITPGCAKKLSPAELLEILQECR